MFQTHEGVRSHGKVKPKKVMGCRTVCGQTRTTVCLVIANFSHPLAVSFTKLMRVSNINCKEARALTRTPLHPNLLFRATHSSIQLLFNPVPLIKGSYPFLSFSHVNVVAAGPALLAATAAALCVAGGSSSSSSSLGHNSVTARWNHSSSQLCVVSTSNIQLQMPSN